MMNQEGWTPSGESRAFDTADRAKEARDGLNKALEKLGKHARWFTDQQIDTSLKLYD